MTILRSIIVAAIICGITGARFPNDHSQEDSDGSSQIFIEKLDSEEELQHDEGEGATILKALPKTRHVPKAEHQQRELDEQGNSEESLADPEPLHFHDKRGRLLVLTEDRRTLTRVNPFGERFIYAIAFTSRPLMDDELLEIKILEINVQAGEDYYLAIGVTTADPDKIKEFPGLILELRAPGWFLYGVDGKQCLGECMPIYDIKLPRNGQVNDTLGVKRTSGDISFYFNKDLIGTVETGFYGEVYGVVDVEYNVDKITITS